MIKHTFFNIILKMTRTIFEGRKKKNTLDKEIKTDSQCTRLSVTKFFWFRFSGKV